MTCKWRGGAGPRLVTLVAVIVLVVAGLSPAALAQDEATETPVAEEASGPDLNPADNGGSSRLNPNVTSGGSANLNPMIKPATERAPDESPAEVADAATDEGSETDQTATADAAEGDREVEAAQAAGGTDGETGASQDAAQPLAVQQPAASNSDTGVGGGGSADSTGSGGTIIQSAGITGNNRGSEILVQDCAYGSVQIDGGTIINATDIDLSANGGTAVSTANGGDDNVVRAGGAVASQLITAGNGGSADSNANGGTIITGAMITGNNRGHEVSFADCPNGRGNATLVIDAGDITNTTSIDLSADGGTAISDASGGSGNLGITGGLGDAAAGNGGSADSEANGGLIMTSAIITGNNRGNTIVVGNAAGDGTTSGGGYAPCAGPATVVIDGGDVTNTTELHLSVDGGTAISDASGGDDNIGAGGEAAAGNGGSADSQANGGRITTDAMITGNNRGNSISVGNVAGCAPVAAPATAPQGQVGAPGRVAAPKQITQAGGKGKRPGVGALPNTGTGPVAGTATSSQLVTLTLLGGLAAGLVALRRQLIWD